MSKSKLSAITLGVLALVLIAFTVVQAQNLIVAEDVLEQGQQEVITNTPTKKHKPHKTRRPPPPPPRPVPGGPGNLEFIVFYVTLGVLLLTVIGVGLFLRKKSQRKT